MSDMNDFIIEDGVLTKYNGKDSDVTIPEGVISIGNEAFMFCGHITNITIPDGVTSIGDEAFDFCDNLTNIMIPDGVTEIGREAFAFCKSLTVITIPEGVISVGSSCFEQCISLKRVSLPSTIKSLGIFAFMDCNNLTQIVLTDEIIKNWDVGLNNISSIMIIVDGDRRSFYVCPNYPKYYGKWNKYDPSLLTGETKCKKSIRLIGIMGRLMNPVELSDKNRELFIEYVRKNIKDLVSVAVSENLPEIVKALFDTGVVNSNNEAKVRKLISESGSSEFAALADTPLAAVAETQATPIKKKKAVPALSDLKKVELLEEKVLANDIEGVKTVFEDYYPIEFTARALGLACHYCGAEMVKTLIECGASFEYEVTPALKRKYNCSTKLSNYTEEPVYYELYLFDDMYKQNSKNKIIDVSERVKVLEILKQKNEGALALVLYYAILRSEDEIYQKLIELGVDRIPWFYSGVVAGTEGKYHERGDFDWYLEKKNSKNLPDMLERLLHCMEGDKIAIYPRNLYGDRYGDGKFRKKFCAVKAFEIMVEHTDMVAKAKTWDLINAIIEENNVTAIKYALENKWISTQEDIDKLEKAVSKRKKCSAEFVGCILEVKRQQDQGFDKSLTDELSLDGKDQTPTAILKKIWGTKKLEDGTLMIISYKGEETDVVIPSVIGKNTVTAISPETFNPSAPRISDELSEVRRSIVSVTIPGTIRKIPEIMFAYCEKNSLVYDLAECKNIKKIVLEDGITEICDKAFYGCTGIKSIVIPESVQIIGESAFERCIKLEKITLPKQIHRLPDRVFFQTGFIDYALGDQINSLGESVFAYCDKLQSVKFNENITSIPENLFEGCTALHTIELPDSLESIGKCAFYGCIALKPFAIPDGVKSIGTDAFWSCDSMADEMGRIVIHDELVGFSTKGEWDSGWTLPPYHDYIEPWKIDNDIKKVSIPPRNFAPLVYREYSGTVECVDLASVNIGDEVEFGRFPSNDNYEMQPLKWIAIARENDMTLLLSKDCLFMLESDLATYSYKKWSNSSIRKMLNNGFMNMAFVSEERDHICKVSNSTTYSVRKGKVDTEQTKDNVFLLSKEEVEKYLPEEKDRISQFAPRAVMFGDDTSCKYDRDYWVTRTPAGYGVEGVSISKGFFTNRGSGYCRPAMWVK